MFSPQYAEGSKSFVTICLVIIWKKPCKGHNPAAQGIALGS